MQFYDEDSLKPKPNEQIEKCNPKNDDKNFFLSSANQLIHILIYMDAIPTIVQGIVPINYLDIPDYCQKFEEEKLEQMMSEDKSVSSCKDFSEIHNDFSETQKSLAEIWRNVLSLSEEEYRNLDKESDFFDLAPSWCVTFELIFLKKEISRVFEISIDSIAMDDHSTLSEQAILIDRMINQDSE